MSDPAYLQPDNLLFCLAHVVEEAGEVLSAAGKTQRWGFTSYDPTVPVERRESNANWLKREMKDLREAIRRLEDCMIREGL